MNRLPFLVATMVLTVSCNAQPSANLPDKKSMQVINKADSVFYYQLDPMSDNYGNGNIQNFALDRPDNKPLQQSDIEVIRKMIVDNAGFSDPAHGKFSTFMPNHAFRFIRGKDTIDFLVDLHCNMWRFYSGKKCTVAYFDSLHTQMEAFLNTISFESTDISEGRFQEMQAHPNGDCYNEESILPQHILAILSKVKQCEWQIIDPWECDTSKHDIIDGSLVLQRAENNAQAVQVAQILADKCSFENTPMVKNCLFLPDVAIALSTHDGVRITVVFSFSCDECRIVSGNDVYQFDCLKIRKKILALAKTTFPNDRYIRFMLNR